MKNFIRIIAIFSFIFYLEGNVSAHPVSIDRARQVGSKFINNNTSLRTTANDLRHVATYQTENQRAVFYVFNTVKGFVIVAADDCATPILGYSDEGLFDRDNIPSQMESYLQHFIEQIQYGINNHVESDVIIDRQWELVQSKGLLTEHRSTSSVAPLLNNSWGQGCYYNDLCPEDPEGSCGHVVTGCVATSLAQIMHFWGYPSTGSGSHSYTPSGYPTQTANFGATTYEWTNMPNILTSSSTPTQIDAVATLMWHCGVAVNMMYGTGGSGAYSEDVVFALVNYFGYSNDLHGVYKNDYSNAEWLDMMKSCLDLGQPIHYSGNDGTGASGHAFVCDGYDSNDLLHFNWGWNGSYNNYFALDALNPGTHNFSYGNYAILDIHPSCSFGTTYQVNATASPSYCGSVSGNGSFSCGEMCTLIAEPANGYTFCSWTDNVGNVISTEPTYSFIVWENQSLEANFVEIVGDQCTLVFNLHDSYGDGWNGNTLQVNYGNGCGSELLTINSGSSETMIRNVTDGSHITLNWIPGNWIEECSFTITLENGNLIYEGSNLSSGFSYEFDMDCEYSPISHTDALLGNTTYDWQSNSGARTWTHVWPDGKVSFAFTTASESSFSDRGTGIGTYDAINDEWIASPGRVENERTGFGSIAQYGNNGIVIAAHTASDCRIYIIPDKDNIPYNSLEATNILDNTYLPTWPAVMTSGSNRDIIHVIANADDGTVFGMENDTKPFIYFRSSDGGQTWDKENIFLPYMTSDYCLYWSSNNCYWMETTEDNCLALVVNNPWSDGMVIYSYDDGETWQRKVFYKHPNPFGSFDEPFYYPRWVSAQWDSNHNLHVLYEYNGSTGEVGSGSFYPIIGGVAYWNETMPYNVNGTTTSAIPGNLTPGQPFLIDNDYLTNDIHNSWWGWESPSHEMWPEYIGYLPPLTNEGIPETPYYGMDYNLYSEESRGQHGRYNQGVCAFPVLCMVPNSDEMVAVWSALDENNTDMNGNHYYKLFASYSSDGGSSWSPMVSLTSEPIYQNTEFIYNQATVIGRKLIVVSQTDSQTGSFVQSDDNNPFDNYYSGLVFDIDLLFDSHQEYTITTSADPEEGGTITPSAVYPNGELCTLTATPYEDYNFVNWTKDGLVVSTSPTFSFTVTEDAYYVAHFAWFDGITVGSGTETNEYLPSYSYYCHSLSQQIYTFDDFGMVGTINSLAFFNNGGEKTRTLDIYLANTEKTCFENNNDWIAVAPENLVFSGTVTMYANMWTTLVLDNPFFYDGTNLALVVDDNTGSYTGAPHMACRVFPTDAMQAMRIYSDNTNYDPFNPLQYTATATYYAKNQLRLTIEPSAISTPMVYPNPIDMGYRPNDAWMRPFSFNLFTPETYTIINNVTTSNPYFMLETDELSYPLILGLQNSKDIVVDWSTGNGPMNGVLKIDYGDSQVVRYNMKANAYTPSTPDVWETAQTVTSFPFTANLNAANHPLYNNYVLPPASIPDGPDAVYKMTFTQDTYLNASVTNGENGKVALYQDGFMDVGGPDLDNIYTGPKMNDKNNNDSDASVISMTIPPGTYYLAASSTSNQWTMNVNATQPPCPEAAYNPTPVSGSTDLHPSIVELGWTLDNNTTSYKLLFGTDPENMETLIDWTRELDNQYLLTELHNNTIYYWQIWQRNDGCPEGVSGTLWNFTTHLNIPIDLYAYNNYMFEDETNTLYWNAPNERSLLSYNIYMNDNLIGNTNETYYTISGLGYNMAGHRFNVTAVYDEGESYYSNDLWVYVSGYGSVEGHVYEQDGITPIANTRITFNGYDEFGWDRNITFTTDTEGYFSGILYAGQYNPTASCQGYQPKAYGEVTVLYDETFSNINFFLDENFTPVGEVVAEYYPDNNSASPYVKVYWTTSINLFEDFETGDFSKFDWLIDGNYPWQITDQDPHDGSYCMKSSNNNHNTISRMEATVNIPYDCSISFFGKVSSESGYDYGHFYIDAVEQGRWSGETNWFQASYPVSQGVHVFTWSYSKDGSVNNGNDCFFVDDINFGDTESSRSFQYFRVYRTSEYNNGPYTEDNTTLLSEALTDTLLIDYTWLDAELGSYKYGVSRVYEGNRGNREVFASQDFESGSLGDWTTIDADGDGNDWYVLLNSTTTNEIPGHNNSDGHVTSASYINAALYPDNYLVSPLVALGGSITFWACAQDANWAVEHFGVAVSTTTNNSASAFTTIQEWTMTSKGAGQPTNACRSGNRVQGNWYQYTVDLSAYAGQTGYVAIRHFGCTDMFRLNVDDVEITVTTIQEERESRIIWSNNIDKGMNLDGGQVTLNVTLDSGDSPEGTLVSFTNLNENEQTYHPTHNVILDETGSYSWDHFRKGDYQVTVTKDGYTTVSQTVSIWNATALNYVLNEITLDPSNLYVSSTGWAQWEGIGDFFDTFGANEFYVDFEEGLPDDWTIIDANNDGLTWTTVADIPYTWSYYAGLNLDWNHSGVNAICSGSYINGIGSINPDEYLVSPKMNITQGSHLRFWAVATDPNYAADHFGVFVSTTSNTDPSSFEMIQEWTLTAKDGGQTTSKETTREGKGLRVGTWRQYDVDLSAYAAQQVYIAFRHFNCFDQYILSIDDVELYNSHNNDRHYAYNQVVLTDDNNNVLYRGNTNNRYCQLPVENLVEGQTYHCKVASVYSSGFTDWIYADWVYTPCDHYEGTEELTITTTDEGNLIEWTYPSTAFSALVYRDDVLLGLTYHNNFLDLNETGGHQYTLRIIHDGVTDDYSYFSMSCPQSIINTETQTIFLQEGWTWFSSYINYTGTTLDDFKAQIEAAEAYGIIKSQNAYTANDLDGWSGSLTSLDNTQMYMTLMDQELTLTITGQRINPSQQTIVLYPGWTWIAYPMATPMSIEEAFADVEKSDGDLIKSQHQFSSYNTEDGWTGSLNTLQPGEGYVILNNSNDIKILIIQNRK